MLLYIIAIYLEYVALSTNIAIIIVIEALFYPIGIVIELVEVDLPVLYYPSIDNYISYF